MKQYKNKKMATISMTQTARDFHTNPIHSTEFHVLVKWYNSLQGKASLFELDLAAITNMTRAWNSRSPTLDYFCKTVVLITVSDSDVDDFFKSFEEKKLETWNEYD